MTKLIIIRHCETESNVKGEMQGYFNDSDFTLKGKLQAERLLNKLKNEKIDAIYCSDLGRALKTAQTIASVHNKEPIKMKELREGDIGDWRSLPIKEGIQKWINYYEEEKKKGRAREEIRPPNGENSWDHQKRVMKALREIITKYPQGNVIVVGHSGTNKVILGSFENKDPDDFYTVPQDNACINTIETDGNVSKVICINDTEHLKDEAD